ncbi:hypothetical protein Tco_0726902 [Tanacetum coccineum]|uniref:Uncharacterized protein n=1 Tax=Tanacetum coccineum TaxID=301880 RepID=A0ABQ4YHY7_9ASTR
MKAVRSSSHVLIVPSFNSSSHVFASPVSDRGNIIMQKTSFSVSLYLNILHILWNSNGDCETRSQRDNTIGNPHGFIVNGIEVLKGNEKVTEVIDVENWRVDKSQLLRWIVSLFKWNSFVLSTNSSIQSSFRFRLWLDVRADAVVYYVTSHELDL